MHECRVAKQTSSMNKTGLYLFSNHSGWEKDNLHGVLTARSMDLRKRLSFQAMNRTASGPLTIPIGPDTSSIQLSRVELDDIFSGKAKGIALGVEVLTETFHNLQDQSYLSVRKSSFSECFLDSAMRLSIVPNRVKSSSEKGKYEDQNEAINVDNSYKITNSAKVAGLMVSRY